MVSELYINTLSEAVLNFIFIFFRETIRASLSPDINQLSLNVNH